MIVTSHPRGTIPADLWHSSYVVFLESARGTKRPPLGRALKQRQLKEFRAALLEWFAHSQRDLPWRQSRDPYRIWISEIMLQQTRVAAVIPYYEKFLERFPEACARLAAAPEEEVLRMWSGLGYYSRARNLQQAAKQIAAKHGGEFPQTKAEMMELAGIGEYTAAAILSIAFGEKLAVLDGNVARVLARLDAVRGDLRRPGRWRSLQNRADELLEGEAAGDWNQADDGVRRDVVHAAFARVPAMPGTAVL